MHYADCRMRDAPQPLTKCAAHDLGLWRFCCPEKLVFAFGRDGLHRDSPNSLTEVGVDLQWSARTTWQSQPC